MTPPPAIQIGSLSYAVTTDEADYLRAVVDGKQDIYGQVFHGEGRIVFDPKQHAGHMRVTLLHEVLHACYHHTDTALADEETAVRALAGPLLDTLRRNPALVRFLLEDV